MDSHRPHHILFISHTSEMGGANYSLFYLMKELKDNYNITPILLTPYRSGDNDLVARCSEENIQYIITPYYPFKSQKQVKNYVKYILNILFLYPLAIYRLKKVAFDIVHTNISICNIGGYISSYRKVPHVWHLREFGDLDFNMHSIFGVTGERIIYKRGDLFIAISDHIKEHYEKVINKEKIIRIYNGIIPCKKADISKHDNAVFQFVMTGYINSTKNQMEALRAAALLNKETPDFHLNFIGNGDVSYISEMEEFILHHNLQDKVTFWGERNDVPRILASMDAGLMLSRNEAFGRVTVEYMMHNLIVIATNRGANTEIINDKVSGLLYEFGNYKALSTLMSTCIKGKSHIRRIAENGKHSALQTFTIEKNTSGIYKCYLRLLNDHNYDN